MRDEQAPPVVAVVVSHNSGPWLESCLTSLMAQDYENFAVLTVDAASDEPVAGRVAAVAPGFYLHRLEANNGFGPSINDGIATVEGAAYYLVCHDDVILEPDVVRRLVEESFRSNAAIVGPKLVSVDDPDALLQVGLDVDRFGAPVRRVGHFEVDQSQHDEAREVFAVSAACQLVRSDLFATLGGFDREISMFGEDVDLCWRAHLAGARVAVAPRARVAHREATSSRQRHLPEARALQWRHELRSVLKNYGSTARIRVIGELLVLSVLEAIFFVVTGKRRRVRQVIDAWRWNLSKERGLDEARRATAAIRQCSDRSFSSLFASSSSRAGRFLKSKAEQIVRSASDRRDRAGHQTQGAAGIGSGSRRLYVVPLLLAGLVVLVGSRSYLVGHAPGVGQWLGVPSPPHLLAKYFGGWNDAGSQSPGPAPPAFAIIGLAGFLFFGATTGMVKFAILVSIALGAFGTSRLVGRVAGGKSGGLARLAGGIGYLFLPLCWNDLAAGNLQAVVAYGALPFIVIRLLDAGVTREPDDPSLGEGSKHAWILEVAKLGLFLFLVGSLSPVVLILTTVVAVVLPIGLMVAGATNFRGIRVGSIGLGAVGLAVALAMPWSITFFQPGARWSALFGSTSSAALAPSVATLIRFETGPIGHGLTGYALLAAAAVVLFIGRDRRFQLATGLFFLAFAGWALAWSGARGWLGVGGSSVSALLVLPAIGIATCAGLALESVLVDLPGRRFGWRQLAGPAFVVVAAASLLPVLIASGSGRWGLPDTGYDTVLSFLGTPLPSAMGVSLPKSATTTGTEVKSGAKRLVGRVLWVGDASALPLGSWQIGPGLAAGISNPGLPDITRVWPSAVPGQDAPVLTGVVDAEHSLTVRLGAILASHGISYLVVPSYAAPVLAGTQSALATPPPTALLAGLGSQEDLHQLPSEGGIYVFAVTENIGSTSMAGASGGFITPSPLRVLAVILEMLAVLGLVVYLWNDRAVKDRRRQSMRHSAKGQP